MGEKVSKTNAARLLDRAKIHYELIPYRVDEDDLAAVHVAEQLGEPIERVFKTLVLRGDRTGVLICVVPGDAEVDLKAAGPRIGQQERRDAAHERTAADDRLYPGRLLADRDEKVLSDLYPFDLPALQFDLRQRRRARIADSYRARRPDPYDGRIGRRSDSLSVCVR